MVQQLGVISGGELLLLQVAVEEISKGDTDLSIWDEIARGGVRGPEELFGTEGDGWLNKHLATVEPWAKDPFGTKFGTAEDDWADSWLLSALADAETVSAPAHFKIQSE